MGPWDTFKDWWYFGEKTTYISGLYDGIHSPSIYLNYSDFSLTRWPLEELLNHPDVFLRDVDEQGKSLADRVTESGEADALEHYLSLLELFLRIHPQDERQVDRELVVNSLLKLSLPLFLDAWPGLNLDTRLHSIQRFLLRNAPELTKSVVSKLLTNTTILSELDNFNVNVRCGILELLTVPSSVVESDEITAFKRAISDTATDFFTHRIGEQQLCLALISENEYRINWYCALLSLMSEEKRTPIISRLLAKVDSSGQPVLESAFKKGHYAAVTKVLEFTDYWFRSTAINELLQGQNYACFKSALLVGKLKDFNGCVALLDMLSQNNATGLWKSMFLVSKPDLVYALTEGLDKDIQRYKPLILSVVETILKCGEPGDLFFVLENLPVNMLEEVVKMLLDNKFYYAVIPRMLAYYHGAPVHSLLLFIDRLPTKENALKKRLTTLVAEKLNSLFIRSVVSVDIEWGREGVEAIWLANPIYYELPAVAEFVCAPVIAQANAGLLKTDDSRLPLLLDYVLKIVALEKNKTLPVSSKFMIKNNGFFIQLICRCANHSDPALKKKAEDLYDSYLDLPELSTHKKLLEDVWQVDDGIRSASLYLFVWFSAGKSLLDGMVLGADGINKILGGDPSFDWPTTGFLTEKIVMSNGVSSKQLVAASKAEVDVATALADFPVFATSVQGRLGSLAWAGLLDLLDLNYRQATDVSGPADYDYRRDFNQALSFNASSTKLVDDEHQKRLGQLFGRHLHFQSVSGSQRTEPVLTDAHLVQVVELFGLAEDTAAEKLEAARKLFCLAAMFARLSSEDYFGVTGVSPQGLRDYAAALLSHAHLLDPTVCGAQYDDMMDRLLGRRSKPTESAPQGRWPETCTQVLYCNIMVPIAKSQPDFKKIFEDFMPRAWSGIAA